MKWHESFCRAKKHYANSVWITENNVNKANIWKLDMKFEANKDFMENLSLRFEKQLLKNIKALRE